MTPANLVAMPLVIPLVSAAGLLLLLGLPRVGRWVNLLSSLLVLGVGAILVSAQGQETTTVLAFGGWRAPYGIVFVQDMLSSLMVLMAGLVASLCAVHALELPKPELERAGLFPLMQLLLAASCGSFLTGDLFNLFVWFELLLMSGLALSSLGGTRAELEGTLKLFGINLIGSFIFLLSCGMFYGSLGTLNMAQISQLLPGNPLPIASMMMIFVVLTKAAAFPVGTWLPASYSAPSPVVAAILAGLSTKVGTYVLIRWQSLSPAVPLELLMGVGILTILFGSFGALGTRNVRQMIAFHILSQIGFVIVGVASGSPLGLAGAILHVFHNAVLKPGLFFVIDRPSGAAPVRDLDDLRGYADRWPIAAIGFGLVAAALVGIPPLAGFISKIMLVQGSRVDIGLLLLGFSLVSLIYMLRIAAAMIRPSDVRDAFRGPRFSVALVAFCAVGLGIGAGFTTDYAARTSRQLAVRGEYQSKVLEEAR